MYSDGTTPPVTYTYDRLGRVTGILDGAGTRAIAYSDLGLRLSEDWSNPGGLISSAGIVRGEDALHRLSSMTPTVNGTASSTITYGYDTAGRMSIVGEASQSRTNTYTYNPTNGHIASLVVTNSGLPVLTITRGHDALDRLTGITNTIHTTPETEHSWTYTYNDANQRTRATLADGSYWSYAYDPLGQVMGGSKRTAANTAIPGMQFGYWFDDIGNRRTETNNAQVSAYTANALNQYEKRTVPGVVDIIGEATENAKVVVNATPAAQLGARFHAQVEVDNTAAAQYPEIKAIVGQAGSPDVYLAETKGKRFVAKTPEVFDYDEDGNLKQDGRWIYTWDAENRLIKMETLDAVVDDANVPYRCLEFTYDANSRRTGKKIYSGSHDVPVLESTTAYLYDGWNLIQEVTTPASGGSSTTRYIWGLDLSQSLQGAGGVGGLLGILTPDSSLLTPCYDGNGNVMALVDTADGSIAAAYEYDPFGNTLRASGARAAANPFRFSTKYTDDETGLVYYGFRYYCPALGRWPNRDPDASHYQEFIFCANRCTGYFDALGMDALPSDELIDVAAGTSDILVFAPLPEANMFNANLNEISLGSTPQPAWVLSVHCKCLDNNIGSVPLITIVENFLATPGREKIKDPKARFVSFIQVNLQDEEGNQFGVNQEALIYAINFERMHRAFYLSPSSTVCRSECASFLENSLAVAPKSRFVVQ